MSGRKALSKCPKLIYLCVYRAKQVYWSTKEARDLVQRYVNEHELTRPKGMVALDPNVVRLLDQKPQHGT